MSLPVWEEMNLPSWPSIPLRYNSEIFTDRLQSLIDARNNQKNRNYKLSISVGCSFYDPGNPCSIDELMVQADQLMYEEKRNKNAPPL